MVILKSYTVNFTCGREGFRENEFKNLFSANPQNNLNTGYAWMMHVAHLRRVCLCFSYSNVA